MFISINVNAHDAQMEQKMVKFCTFLGLILEEVGEDYIRTAQASVEERKHPKYERVVSNIASSLKSHGEIYHYLDCKNLSILLEK
jgi:hypothetical protein